MTLEAASVTPGKGCFSAAYRCGQPFITFATPPAPQGPPRNASPGLAFY